MSSGGKIAEMGSNPNSVSKGPVVEWDEENDSPKSSLCCLQGCLAVSAVGFSVFVALPTGIILVVLGSNSNDTSLLSVGGVLVTLPILMLIVVIVLCLNQKKLCCNTCQNKSSSRKTVGTTQTVHTTASSAESPA